MAELPTILAYGDSLTWGQNARAGRRHFWEDRWPTRLEMGLEGRARVVADGLRGRTTAADISLAAADRNGATLLPTVVDTHWPLALVILMLGTNDLMSPHRWTAMEASFGIRRLIQIVRATALLPHASPPAILVVAPPIVVALEDVAFEDAEIELQHWHDMQRRESRALARHYRLIAGQHGAEFFDAASVAMADRIDGVHLDAANSRAIGDALVPVVARLLEAR